MVYCSNGYCYRNHDIFVTGDVMPYKDPADPRKKENNRKRQQKWRERQKEKIQNAIS